MKKMMNRISSTTSTLPIKLHQKIALIIIIGLQIFLTAFSCSSSSSPSSSSLLLFVSAQTSEECFNNRENFCTAGRYLYAVADPNSTNGCRCVCNEAWNGYFCEQCTLLGSTRISENECRCQAGWSFNEQGICVRPCSSTLDCNEHANGVSSRDGSGNFPPVNNCLCQCRNYWDSVNGSQCNYCPPFLEPELLEGGGGDCGSCAKGFFGFPSTGCHRPCNVQADCFGRASGVTGMWVDDVSNCSCACDNQFLRPNCRVCPWPYAGVNCSECAEFRDTYPSCIGKCSVEMNCTGIENVENVSRVGGQCRCKCRNEWSGPNQTDCSVCPPHGVEHRDCVPKTLTHELTPTDSISSSSSHSSSISPSPSLSISESQSLSISESESSSVSLTNTMSLSRFTPSFSDTDTRTHQTLATVSGNTDTLSPSASLSLERTATDTIVVCYMYDCGQGANNTFYSEIYRHCICNCRTRWENATGCNNQFCQCDVCPFNVNASLDCGFCALGFYNMTPLVPATQTIEAHTLPNPLLPPTTTTLSPPSSSNSTSSSSTPLPPGRCDCSSHVLTEVSTPTVVGVPEDIEAFSSALSEDLVRYVEEKCFGFIKVYAIPFYGVVNLETNMITTQLEIIALTSPIMELQSCPLKPSATACLVNALSTVISVPSDPSDPNSAPIKQKKQNFCIPTLNVLNVTNFTSTSASEICFDVNMEIPVEEPYSPCANATQLSCPEMETFDVIPASVPSWLWLILLILAAVLLVLGILAYCCWRYYPVFAAYRERKRKQEHEELLLALAEAEMEEKEAGLLLPGDDEISACSSGDDDEEEKDQKLNNAKGEGSDDGDDDDDDDSDDSDDTGEESSDTKRNKNHSDTNENEEIPTSVLTQSAKREDEDDDDDDDDRMKLLLGTAIQDDYNYSQQQQKRNKKSSRNTMMLNSENLLDHEDDDVDVVNNNVDNYGKQNFVIEEDDFSYRKRPDRPFFSSSSSSKNRNRRLQRETGDNTSYNNNTSKLSDTKNDDIITDDAAAEVATSTSMENFFSPTAATASSSTTRTRTPRERLNQAEEEAEAEMMSSGSRRRSNFDKINSRKSNRNRNMKRVNVHADEFDDDDDDDAEEENDDDDDIPAMTPSGRRARQLSRMMMIEHANNNNKNTSSSRSHRPSSSSSKSGRDVWNNLTRINLADI